MSVKAPEAVVGIGSSLRRREDERLLRGEGRYVSDIRLPGMLHLAVVRSLHAHAQINSLHTGAAERLPGVEWVMTPADVIPAVEPFRLRHTAQTIKKMVWYPLAADRARYVGEPLAAVVGKTRYICEDARDLVEVGYDPLPPLATTREALLPTAPRLYEEWPDNVHYHYRIENGDVDQAFASADIVIRDTFSSQRYTGHPMETRGVVASYENGDLTVWISHQAPHMFRTLLTEVLRLPENRVRVIAPDVGGAFGVKLHIYPEDVLVCLASMKLRRPVKWIEDRQEHFVGTVHAREQRHDAELAATREGVILGVRNRITTDVGTGTILQPSIGPTTSAAVILPGPYRFQNYRCDLQCVVTNKTPYGAYRGFGSPVGAFVMERLMDMLAEQTGLDPAEVRRRNMVTPEEMPFQSASGSLLDSGDYPGCLAHALEIVDYEGWRRKQAEGRREGRFIGIGIGAYIKGSGSDIRASMGGWGAYESAVLRMDPDGSLTLYTGLAAQGQGHQTSMGQVVASYLRVDPERVSVVEGDTLICPYGLGAWGSRSSTIGAGAVVRACEAMIDRLCRQAAIYFEVDQSDVRFVDGLFSVPGSAHEPLTLKQLARHCYHEAGTLPEEMKPPLQVTGRFDGKSYMMPGGAGSGRINKWVTYSNGVHVAVCEVDPESGIVKLLDYAIVGDCGVQVNPMIVRGQEIGGAVQGIGGALLEELVYDSQGQLLTGSYMDYLLPTATDVPKIRVDHLVHPSVQVPGGFKGAGEGASVGATATVANAVADALRPFGVRVTATPLSPERLWRAVQVSRATAE